MQRKRKMMTLRMTRMNGKVVEDEVDDHDVAEDEVEDDQ